MDPEESLVLLTEAPLNPKNNREHTTSTMFEKFSVPGMYLSMQAALALYARGPTTGLVLDSGDGVTHTVPIHEGYPVANCIVRSNVAGRDVTDYLMKMLRERGYPFEARGDDETVRDIKEKLCCCYTKPPSDQVDTQNRQVSTWSHHKSLYPDLGEKTYDLADGQRLVVRTEQFRCPEILFKPNLIGSESSGIGDMIFQSIDKCDAEIQNEMYSNIVLSGGTTMIDGFEVRLRRVLKALAPSVEKIEVVCPDDRGFSTWIGGSVVSAMSGFQEMCISLEEYDESGPSIIHRKCAH